MQNVTALAPLKEVHNIRVTNLATLSGVKETKVAPRVVKLEPVPKEEHAREVKAAAQVREIGVQRRVTEAKMLSSGTVPVRHTDPPKAVKLELPKPPPHVVAPRPAVKVVPAKPVIPAHEVREIPKFGAAQAARAEEEVVTGRVRRLRLGTSLPGRKRRFVFLPRDRGWIKR